MDQPPGLRRTSSPSARQMRSPSSTLRLTAPPSVTTSVGAIVISGPRTQVLIGRAINAFRRPFPSTLTGCGVPLATVVSQKPSSTARMLTPMQSVRVPQLIDWWDARMRARRSRSRDVQPLNRLMPQRKPPKARTAAGDKGMSSTNLYHIRTARRPIAPIPTSPLMSAIRSSLAGGRVTSAGDLFQLQDFGGRNRLVIAYRMNLQCRSICRSTEFVALRQRAGNPQ